MQRSFLTILSLLLASASVSHAGESDQIPFDGVDHLPTPVVKGCAGDMPTKASEQLARTPIPSFPPRFSDCNCDGDKYTKGNLNFVIMNGAMATPRPTLYTNDPNGLAPRTPHLFRDAENQFEGQWKNAACSRTGDGGRTNLVEFAVNSVPGTNGYKFDRVVYTIWDVNNPANEPIFCGCMTHKGLTGNRFKLCTTS